MTVVKLLLLLLTTLMLHRLTAVVNCTCVLLFSGIGIICCESSDKPRYWCIPRPGIQRQPRDSTGVVRCYPRRMFPVACCS